MYAQPPGGHGAGPPALLPPEVQTGFAQVLAALTGSKVSNPAPHPITDPTDPQVGMQLSCHLLLASLAGCLNYTAMLG